MLFIAKVNVSPSSVKPISRSPSVKPLPAASSHSSSPPLGVTVMLSGLSQIVRARRIVDELQRFAPRVVLEHLTLTHTSAVGRQKVSQCDRPTTRLRAAGIFAAAFQEALLEYRCRRRLRIGNANPFHFPRGADRMKRRQDRRCVSLRTLSMYELPAAAEAPAAVWNELVESAITRILGFVHVAGARIDHQCFVRETPHVDERCGICRRLGPLQNSSRDRRRPSPRT